MSQITTQKKNIQ